MSGAAPTIGGMSNQMPSRLREQASSQEGAITRQQALATGLTSSIVTAKVRAGYWQPVYEGVYVTFTGRPGRATRLWAALLYAGDGALLSHETAAELNGLSDRQSRLINVTIPGRRRVRPASGIKIHLSAYIDEYAGLRHRFPPGLPPHTFVNDTVIDLVNSAADLDDVAGWVTAAFRKNLTSDTWLRATIGARRRFRWREQIDDVIERAASGSHSALEYRYDRDVERAHGLPQAARQVPFIKPDGRRGYRDRAYAEYGLVIELDGKEYHPDELRRRDRKRDNHATANGGATLRYDWADATRDACGTAAEVYSALRERGYPGKLNPCGPGCLAQAMTGQGRRPA